MKHRWKRLRKKRSNKTLTNTCKSEWMYMLNAWICVCVCACICALLCSRCVVWEGPVRWWRVERQVISIAQVVSKVLLISIVFATEWWRFAALFSTGLNTPRTAGRREKKSALCRSFFLFHKISFFLFWSTFFIILPVIFALTLERNNMFECCFCRRAVENIRFYRVPFVVPRCVAHRFCCSVPCETNVYAYNFALTFIFFRRYSLVCLFCVFSSFTHKFCINSLSVCVFVLLLSWAKKKNTSKSARTNNTLFHSVSSSKILVKQTCFFSHRCG